MQQEVLAWVEQITIPTYGIGKPEKNPIFLEKRIYQGSRGTVYPYPVVEKILDEKHDQEYTAVFIENQYLKIMVLPQLGGRVHRAYDKIRQRDFIYYNQVIKPALVGLTGPWISGGIEFNWPQHHRPSTYSPIDFNIKENEDGSKTIWVNEVELMTRTKGMAGFTLYPDKAYLEIKGKLFNRTPFPQSFLWWANPAVKVNDEYQSVFPPDVYAVFDHGKRDVSDFPVATGTYYKVDYSPGTDISKYKNIPVPTSYMAIQSSYNFIGCYEHDTQAGMLHVANHHISPGKKQWTWGKGDFGIAWDRNLTDEDGPYIELMCGVYTDNQPDFSWIQPNEEKTFEQYFMPYAGIGLVKNATKEAAVNIEIVKDTIAVKVYSTSVYPGATISLKAGDQQLLQESATLSPETIFEQTFRVEKLYTAQELLIEVFDQRGKLLVSYQPEKIEHTTIPLAATAADLPANIETNELLFLNGLHLEQYRHATYLPVDYYAEGLRRDSGDIRCNNAMGLWLSRRAQFEMAEPYFRQAIQRLITRNPNPYDGEAYYNLGFCLKMQNRPKEAYDALYKSIWSDAFQHSGYFQLATIALQLHDLPDALYLVNKSLVKNYYSHSARHLKAVILRKLGKLETATEWIKDSLKLDSFNYGCMFEAHLISKEQSNDRQANDQLIKLKALLRNDFNTYTEYVFDYWHAGLHSEANALLTEYEKDNDRDLISPMFFYYMGVLQNRLGDPAKGVVYFQQAAAAKPDFCFPGKIEDVNVLKAAIQYNPGDAKALYYLGNFWYANAQYTEAIDCWERSIALDSQFATVHRNISLAYHNKLHDVARSLAALEKAFALDETDARVLMELDQLYKLQNKLPVERLEILEQHAALVADRDDLYLEMVILYNQLGDFGKAKQLLAERRFHPWEGGEGKTVGQFLLSHIELAKKAILANDCEQALELLAATKNYPHNLGEGKLAGVQENDIYFLQGLAFEGMGATDASTHHFIMATQGISEPQQAIFYNDPQPDKIIYQGFAWIKLGNPQKAELIFNRMVEFGTEHIDDEIRIDYFAVSLPDLLVFDQDLDEKNQVHCNYLVGLGYLGLGNYDKAAFFFKKVLAKNINHQGAAVHLDMIPFLQQVLIPATL